MNMKLGILGNYKAPCIADETPLELNLTEKSSLCSCFNTPCIRKDKQYFCGFVTCKWRLLKKKVSILISHFCLLNAKFFPPPKQLPTRIVALLCNARIKFYAYLLRIKASRCSSFNAQASVGNWTEGGGGEDAYLNLITISPPLKTFSVFQTFDQGRKYTNYS